MKNFLYRLQEMAADKIPWVQYPNVSRVRHRPSAYGASSTPKLDIVLKIIFAVMGFWVLFAPVLAVLAFFLLPAFFGIKAP
ncbi:hypothetical protein [Herbaspirillum huttiense]|uniref:hypothetical protein n=1 Tax=Herbaspirillum huttiense TaxID=863372 RepID=UPI002E77F3A4|nr:hypothetical protein [Herbaspirillum huttiense]MEE1636324.1 hypothetical protein [Herbaspirillum huttiense NC40101]